MNIRLNEKIYGLNGVALQDIDRNGNILGDIVLKSIMIEALLRPHASEERVSGVEKLKRFNLAQKIYESTEEVSLQTEEVALIKELVGVKGFPVLIVGRVFSMLEGRE